MQKRGENIYHHFLCVVSDDILKCQSPDLNSCWQDVLPVFQCFFLYIFFGWFNWSFGHMFVLMLNKHHHHVIVLSVWEQIWTTGLFFFFKRRIFFCLKILLWFLSSQYDEGGGNAEKSYTHFSHSIICINKINKLCCCFASTKVNSVTTKINKARKVWEESSDKH